jgi:hypothetical protein
MKPDETLVGWATAADPITGITAVLPTAEGAKEHDACTECLVIIGNPKT